MDEFSRGGLHEKIIFEGLMPLILACIDGRCDQPAAPCINAMDEFSIDGLNLEKTGL